MQFAEMGPSAWTMGQQEYACEEYVHTWPVGECTFRGMGREGGLNSYRIGPLLYITELLLPELPSAELVPGERPVTVRMGAAPRALAASLTSSQWFEATASEFLLRLPAVATYYVRNGEEVVVEPVAGAPPLDVRSYLMGSIFAALCHQRGLLPLHASAVAADAGAIAFLGASGAGKSSMAAFLGRRGYRIVADDICLIDPAASRERRVVPVAPWLKLWSTTLEALGEGHSGLPRIFSDDDKYRVRLDEDASPIALARLILLERGEDETKPILERLTPVQALHALLDHTYQAWLVRATGQTEAYFQRGGTALDGVRVMRLRRPWGFDGMEETLSLLERHLA
jgi:hypothetical protein